MKEDAEMEKKLGNRFLAKIEHGEGGSTLAGVNRKDDAGIMIKDFLSKMDRE
jgi:hypothetical protein